MTRYINLCRDVPAKKQEDPAPDEEPTKYEKYKETYQLYRNLEGRKEFHKNYNKMYREKHTFEIKCECGITHKSIIRYAHVKSKRHIAFYQKQNTAE